MILAQYTPAMRALILIATIAGLFQAPATPPAQAPAPPPGTDLYLVSLTGSVLTPISTAHGYDNQPSFSPDGGRILFAGNRDGKQTDVYVFNRENSRVTQLTQTAENENSPTYLPAGIGAPGGFSVVQTEPDRAQRLWRFDATGKNPQLVLTDIKPVGYHAWMDADRLVLFILGAQGKPATLQMASVKTGRAESVAEGPGRSLHRIPGTALASFVQRESSGEYWVKQIDPASKKIDPLVTVVEGSTDRDMAWMPDGKTMLMSSGTKVFSWTRGAVGWTEKFDVAPQLGVVSRLAVSPKGDAVAIVVAEPKK